MKYLKRYNESWIHDDLCKSLTGYSYDELKVIFELNLEDNDQFELVGVDGIIDNEGPEDVEVMSLELIEDFSDNVEISKDISNSSGYSQRNIISDEIVRLNTKILYVIAKKYDLNISNIDIIINTSLARKRFIIKFTVSKNTTAQ